MSDELGEAHAALARCEWQAAYDKAVAAEVADRRLDAQRLVVVADAAWWLGRLDECVDARERAYGLFRDEGDARAAASCAVWIYEHYCFKARRSVAASWLRRARQSLEGDTECEEYGALVLREVEEAHGRGELEVAAAGAEAVVALGRRLGSANLEAEARQALARVLIDEGRPRDGLELLDEAMLSASEGRLGPYTTGKVYCSLISACEELGDLRRAADWSEVTAEWAAAHPLAVFPGLCRVHVACALRDRGEFAEAERHARTACTELTGMNVGNVAAAWVAIGEVRRRVGDLFGAEAAFRSAEELAGGAQPGLALVRLAQGRVDAARVIITRALNDITWNRLSRARLLPAATQIALAAGETDRAAEFAGELDDIAAEFASEGLIAAALTTRGRVQLATDDTNACATLRHAAERWHALDVPYEVATARLLLGMACRKLGDDDGATVSFEAARAIFDRLGAQPDVAPEESERDKDRPLPKGLTRREVEVLRLVAAGASNKDVAGALCISQKTVSRHLSNIFTKIGVSSRSAATAFAFSHHLV